MSTENKIIGALKWRYATKEYDATKKLTTEQRDIVMEALRLSPSSFGLQGWKFIHVTDKALREQLKAAAWGQSAITDASELFVLASNITMDAAFVDKYVASTAKARGIAPEMLKGYRDMMIGATAAKSPEDLKAWLAKQVYIALGVAMTAAAENGIDTTPMEGFDPKKFDEILGLAKLGLASCVLLAAGFRSENDKTAPDKSPKSRFTKEEVFIER